MRAIVKPQNVIREVEYNSETNQIFLGYRLNETVEIINEDEWDAEIYALLLLESGVIYE